VTAPILAFVSVKGGVGKTTLALETASSLVNDYGKRVLLVDGNFSAPNIGLYLDLTSDVGLHDVLNGEGIQHSIYEAHGIDIIPASQEYNKKVNIYQLKNVLEKMKARYDFIIIDSSPHYSEMRPVIAASDKVFVVTTPDHVTLTTSLKAVVMAKKNNTPIHGVIVNKIRDPRHEMDLEGVEEIMGLPVVAKIRDNKRVVRAVFNRTPITIENKNNEVAEEINRFAGALCGESEKINGFFQSILPFRWLGIGDYQKERVNRELMRKSFYQEQL